MAIEKRDFGTESTTTEVLQGIHLHGKRALITGGSGGLGAETGRALAAAGAEVLLTARDLAKGEAAAEAIRAETPGACVTVHPLELGSFESIRQLATMLLQEETPLDLLINNAGIMACPLQRTSEGHEMQFGTCHLGHFLLTHQLLPLLARGAGTRVINLSSGGHFLGGLDLSDPDFRNRPYDKWLGYGQAKTANILFTVGLDARFAARGIRSFAVHPGVIATDLARHLDAADIEMLMSSNKDAPLAFKTVPAGAATTCWGATAPELEGKGGRYLLDCRVAEISEDALVGVAATAIDPKVADALWELSENLCGVKFS